MGTIVGVDPHRKSVTVAVLDVNRPGSAGGLGLVRRLGFGSTMVIVSAREELVDGDGLLAVAACPSAAETAHEGSAVLASLLAHEPGLALGTLVDGVVPT